MDFIAKARLRLPVTTRVTFRTKGTWLNEQTFSIDSQDLGYGDQQKVVLSFSGRKLNLRRTDGDGWVVSVDGEHPD